MHHHHSTFFHLCDQHATKQGLEIALLYGRALLEASLRGGIALLLLQDEDAAEESRVTTIFLRRGGGQKKKSG
jgi:hypothetical protein